MNRKSQHSANDGNEDESDLDNVDDDSDASEYLLREKVIKKAWDTLYDRSDLLFCSRNANVNLLNLHPNQIGIFKLWQVYLENVNPLLKLTHTPSLQARIIDAASDMSKINPQFEALVFSIYSMAVFSMNQKDCIEAFGTPREELLASYQLGTREALLNCTFLQTENRECLTALHFYLMTIKPAVDPRALSSMLGTAIRIAQRMGIHNESSNIKCSALEAELRRRLWWSLVLFDARISEMTELKVGQLVPTWDCRPPSNANDFDLRPEMKIAPEVHTFTSETLFAVVRSEFGNFTRHCAFHLDFINPALKSIVARYSPDPLDIDEFTTFEQTIEQKYLRFCDPQNPLHYMTIWWARGQLAKSRFIKDLSDSSKTIAQRTSTQRDATISYALDMLECDTMLMSSELTTGFQWLTYLNFPFPAYVHIVQDLRKRPLSDLAQTSWDVMGKNCTARFIDIETRDNPTERKAHAFFKVFAAVILQAWTARQAAAATRRPSAMEIPPLIVTQIKSRLAFAERNGQNNASKPLDDNDSSNIAPSVLTGINTSEEFNMDGDLLDSGDNPFSVIFSEPPTGFNTQGWGWPTANLYPMMGQGW
ncbi:hypothetical protein CC86DRAFT_292200 [Ophiobolus disseminans]|uniref:Xylanolytic transcriptional activator regulatory domain-containing protein n=1 Tax=Ophiobolus disseminans TaxID=1469910 RepID=A0A6A7A0D5_9PLEO|nr:hypothetical protein CC86DRAFT_292200 [Ophiobolus disseminans]